jgi:hypothetical protein
MMKRSGSMDAIVRSYRGLARSPRTTIATLPTLIGVLPMPGGAIFSAPMVAAVDVEGRLTPGERATANYWFRHAIELVWPLYPSFILASSITGLAPARLSLVNLYSPVALVLAGSYFLLRKYSDPPRRAGSSAPEAAAAPKPAAPVATAPADPPATPRPAEASTPDGSGSGRPITMREHLRDFVRAFSPVLLILAVAFLGDIALDAAMPALSGLLPGLPAAALSRYLPILAGVMAGLLLLAARNPGIPTAGAVLTGATLKIIATVVGVKVFSWVLERIGVASAVAAELSGLGVPAPMVIALLPMFAGLVTGIGFGYVGLAYPIVLALLPSGAGGDDQGIRDRSGGSLRFRRNDAFAAPCLHGGDRRAFRHEAGGHDQAHRRAPRGVPRDRGALVRGAVVLPGLKAAGSGAGEVRTTPGTGGDRAGRLHGHVPESKHRACVAHQVRARDGSWQGTVRGPGLRAASRSPPSLVLVGILTPVDGLPLASFEHELADPLPGNELEEIGSRVQDLQHLVIGDSRLHEGSRDVDHESEPGEPGSRTEPPGDVGGRVTRSRVIPSTSSFGLMMYPWSASSSR